MKDKYKQMYMDMAHTVAKTSTADRLKVGCVIVTKSGMVATGVNGTPSGWHTNACEVKDYMKDCTWGGWIDPRQMYEEYPLEDAGGRYRLVTSPVVRHAERAALDKMLAEGVSSKDAIVFITHAPCVECAKSLIGAQVAEVYYGNDYRCVKGVDMINEYGKIAIQQLQRNALG